MSITYDVVHLQFGGEPIYMGVARRSMMYRVKQFFLG